MQDLRLWTKLNPMVLQSDSVKQPCNPAQPRVHATEQSKNAHYLHQNTTYGTASSHTENIQPKVLFQKQTIFTYKNPAPM